LVSNVGLFQMLMHTLGYKVAASLVLGTAGRSLLKIALSSCGPLVETFGQGFVDRALDVVAPPPIVVLTSEAKKVASDVAKQGVYLIITGIASGAHGILVHLKNLPGVNNVVKFAQNLFVQPEQSATFLSFVEEDKKINFIDEYQATTKLLEHLPNNIYPRLEAPQKTTTNSSVQPRKSNTLPNPTTRTEKTQKQSPTVPLDGQQPQKAVLAPSDHLLQSDKNVKLKSPTLVLQCSAEQNQIIINEFQGPRIEVNSPQELEKIIKENHSWNAVLDLLDEPMISDSPWLSQSVILAKDDQVTEMANSILEGSYVHPFETHQDLYSSWCQLIPSAPPQDF